MANCDRLIATGRAAGGLALANILYGHIDRLASHLFSPSGLRFAMDYENLYEKEWQEKGACEIDLALLADHAEGVHLVLVPAAALLVGALVDAAGAATGGCGLAAAALSTVLGVTAVSGVVFMD